MSSTATRSSPSSCGGSAASARRTHFTIAGRIAIDEHRRARPEAELPELGVEDGRPAFAELEHLAEELPPTERAAVVLRYGYDLDYTDIGVALGSNATAARQAASAGIRRLRRKELQQ